MFDLTSSSTTDFTRFTDARPHYFEGQYLLAEDFTIEQEYLIDRQKYHQKSFHVSGIIEGLKVSKVSKGRKRTIVIEQGAAVNQKGDLIILKESITFTENNQKTFSSDIHNTFIFNKEESSLYTLYISYNEKETAEQNEGFTRFQETPNIEVTPTNLKDFDNSVALAEFSIGDNDDFEIKSDIRRYSGIFLPNATGNDLTLRSGGDDKPNLAVLSGGLEINGSLTVKGDLTDKQSLVIGTISGLSEASETYVTIGAKKSPGIMLSNSSLTWSAWPEDSTSIKTEVPNSFWQVGVNKSMDKSNEYFYFKFYRDKAPYDMLKIYEKRIDEYGNSRVIGELEIDNLSVTKDAKVNGELKIGDLYATRGEESLKIIQGLVDKQGNEGHEGKGFNVQKKTIPYKDGVLSKVEVVYDITFTPRFSQSPTVIVTQICRIQGKESYEDNYRGGSSLDSAVVVWTEPNRCRIKCGNSAGEGVERNFSFICIGT